MLAATAGLSAGLLFSIGAIALLLIVADWIIFTKMGLPGWKSIIPLYGTYVALEKIWSVKIGFPIYIAGTLLSCFSTYVLSSNVSDYVGYIGLIFTLLFLFMYSFYLARAFNKSAGFAIGLILLPVIFYPILAFGSSEYVRNTYECNEKKTE